jgi:UDP-GlcNAc3NAcA epimerase
MKILTVLGARPQFIKAGNVSREIAKYPDIQEIIVHTGQHYDANMSDIFFDEMKIPKPTYHLGIGGESHGAMTGRMMEKLEEIAQREKPDWIVVYGDTNSTLAGAIVASKLQIKLAHVEAGLRSFNMTMPEEINRILTDRISNLLFCPTDTAIHNLQSEGFDSFGCSIVKNGDVMYDGALYYRQFAKKPNLKLDNPFILCTVHRAENTDNIDRLKSIISALNTIAKEKQILFPIHPRTKKVIEKNNISIDFTLIDPVGYLEMIWLIDHCSLVMTDSGGLQKEAFFFEKQCITLRDETEWVELVQGGFNILSGSESKNILHVYNQMKDKAADFSLNLYGDGTASQIVVESLLSQ